MASTKTDNTPNSNWFSNAIGGIASALGIGKKQTNTTATNIKNQKAINSSIQNSYGASSKSAASSSSKSYSSSKSSKSSGSSKGSGGGGGNTIIQQGISEAAVKKLIEEHKDKTAQEIKKVLQGLDVVVTSKYPKIAKDNIEPTEDNLKKIDEEIAPERIGRVATFAERKNISVNHETGEVKLKPMSTSQLIGMTDEEAAKTEFNPWDDDASNRPATTDITPTTREYKITKGKDGQNDWASEFPAMTFFTSKDTKLTGLMIPIVKFQNCEGIKFQIWKRQGDNNKSNTVWLEKRLYTSETFSLANAREADGFQFIDEGFTIQFPNGGLDLPKGQYVIIALHIPKSGVGSCFVDTYKPKNPKDFCIRYYGAANASHFLLKERYYEIWYNKAKATGEITDYEKEGYWTSAVFNVKESLPPIEKIQTTMGDVKIPTGCSVEIFGDTGGGWQKLNTDSELIDTDEGNTTIMNGDRRTLKIKVVLKGDGKNTPTLNNNDKAKGIIKLNVIYETPSVGNISEALKIDKNMCLTSQPIDGDKILQNYIGDLNFDRDSSKFSNFEFARVWAQENDNEHLIIDVSGSDNEQTVKDKNGKKYQVPVYSLFYSDLTLDDFAKMSVDYSNYDATFEDDEHNLRLKLDSENSYEDNDIKIVDESKFEEVGDSAKVITFNDGYCDIPANYQPNENILLWRLRLENPIDLTKHTGVKFSFTVKGSTAEEEKKIKGLGVYLSSQHELESVPSNNSNDPENIAILEDTNTLLSVIKNTTTSQTLLDKYKDKIIKIVHVDENIKNNVKTYQDTFYQYIPYYDDETNSLAYKLTLLHDIKNYYIYQVSEFEIKKEDNKYFKEIEIDQNSTNLQYVREIGIILLGGEKDANDEAKLSIGGAVSLKLDEFRSIEHDYYPAFNPAERTLTPYDSTFTDIDDTYFIRKHGDMIINKDTYGALGQQKEVPKEFDHPTNQINIDPHHIHENGETLCYFSNDIATKDYRHIGIQIAADVYIPKYSLRVNLCRDSYGKDVIDYVNIPTLNYIWTPNETGAITFSQVFKKIDEMDERVKSISISTTNRFKRYIDKVVDTEKTTTKTNKDGTQTTTTTEEIVKPRINLFIGKIVMYKARTIPMFHRRMRFKFYDDNIDGTEDSVDIAIRKIGAVLVYK